MTMQNVTADEVMQAVSAAGITHVDHHDCSFCGYMVHYSIADGQAYFHPGCNCGFWSEPEPRSWQSIADWINMQNDEWKVKLAARFGIAEPTPTHPATGG